MEVDGDKSGSKWLSGYNEPMMVDIYAFTLVERIVLLENSLFHSGFLLAPMPTV